MSNRSRNYNLRQSIGITRHSRAAILVFAVGLVCLALYLGLIMVDRDEAFYYKNKDGKLYGAVKTNIDNFSVTVTEFFLVRVIQGVEEFLAVSK